MAIFALLLTVLVALLASSPPAGAGSGLSTFTVSVSRSGSGAGTVTSQPAGIVCGSDCSFDFPNSGEPVTLVAKAGKGSRLKGWDGTVKGTSRTLRVSPPTDGLPVEIEATFERTAPPTARLLGKSLKGRPLPRKLRLRLNCRADVPCRLKVTVLLGIWASKKGYDYYKASSAVYSPPDGGSSAWNVSSCCDKATPILYNKRLNRSKAKKGAVRIVVKDLETGLGMAINEKAVAPKKPEKKGNR